MEQYVQLLIPADTQFAPKPEQISGFLQLVIDLFGCRIDCNRSYIHALRILKLMSKAEINAAIEAQSGPVKTFPLLETLKLKEISEIPLRTETLSRFSVNASVIWSGGEPPITIPSALWPKSTESLSGSISLEVHPESVMTSNVWYQDGEWVLSRFRDPVDEPQSVGAFTHPLSRRNIEIDDAGSARFWLEFDFGEWIVPHLPEDFSLLNPPLVGLAESHFGVKMSQAGLALP